MTNIVRLRPQLSPSVIPEDQVSLSRLATLLESAVIDYNLEHDGVLYATEGLPFAIWIDILREQKLIVFCTYVSPDKDDTKDNLTLVNNANSSIIGVQFHLAEDRLWGHYWISFNCGLNARQFIQQARWFAGAFVAGVQLD